MSIKDFLTIGSGEKGTRSGARLAVSLGVVAAITLVYSATALANTLTVALTYLLAILAIAAGWGLAQATAASLLATLCLNYFFMPPYRTLTIADPQNWVALFTFLVVGIVASQLSERARREAREAVQSRRETERLYALSRMILMRGGNPEQVARETADQIARVFEVEGVALFDRETGRIFRAGPSDPPVSEANMKEVAAARTSRRDRETGLIVLPIDLGGKAVGSIALFGATLSDGALHAMANLVAIGLESAHNQEIAGRAELARRSEEFKSTLLDTLAHELKTPLTGIKAAVTAVLHKQTGLPSGERELLTVIDEESDRLSRLINESIQMARIEAGKLRLNLGALSVRELVESALARLRTEMEGREVRIESDGSLPPVMADAELTDVVLRQLLDNAAKYSAPGTPIIVSARVDGAHVRIGVQDEGPGISEQEQDRVFEKFYRRSGTTDSIPGLGIGLAIARDMVIGQGGRMWLESVPGQGSRFFFTLPAATKRAAP